MASVDRHSDTDSEFGEARSDSERGFECAAYPVRDAGRVGARSRSGADEGPACDLVSAAPVTLTVYAVIAVSVALVVFRRRDVAS